MGTQNECSERTHSNKGDRTTSNDTLVDRVSVSKAFPTHTITPPFRGSRRSRRGRPACRPKRLMRYGGGSISRILFRIDRAYGGDHVSTAHVTISLQRPTREPRPGRPLPNVPTRPRTRRSPRKAKQAVRRVLLFGLAPGDACPAIHVAADAVGSYPTISPLPRDRSEDGPGRYIFCGAHVGLLRLGVTQHPALWSPDFPLTRDGRAAT